MKFALQHCCTTPVFLQQYETSTDALLKHLGVEFKDIKEFNCCGYPLKNIDNRAHMLCSARNLALAEREGLDILTFCNCCFSTLKRVNHSLQDEAPLVAEINGSLAGDGLEYRGEVRVRHLLEVLSEDIGVDRIRERLLKRFSGLKIATHYGCHILRPREIMQFDNPIAPTVFDRLVELTGAESIPWSKKLDCCGSAIWGIDDALSMDLAGKKITNAGHSGADYLCTACPFCQLQFDRTQKMLISERNDVQPLPAILFTQLLGLCLGLDGRALGLDKNEMDARGITKYLQ